MNEYELKRIVEAVLFVSEKPMTVKEIWQKLFGPSVSIREQNSKAAKTNDGPDQEKQASSAPDTDDPDKREPSLDPQSVSQSALQDDAPDLSDESFMDYGVSKDDVYQALCALQSDYAGRGCELQEVASGYRFQVNADLALWLQRWKAEKPPRYSRAVLETLAIIAYKQPITRAEIEDIRGVAVSSHIVKGLLEREWVRIVGHKEVPGRPALFATTKTFLDYFNVTSLEDLPTLAEIKELGVKQGTEGAAAVSKVGDAMPAGRDLPDSSPDVFEAEIVALSNNAAVHAAVAGDEASDPEVSQSPEKDLELKQADNTIKNAVECDSGELVETESIESPESETLLGDDIQGGSVFDQLPVDDDSLAVDQFIGNADGVDSDGDSDNDGADGVRDHQTSGKLVDSKVIQDSQDTISTEEAGAERASNELGASLELPDEHAEDAQVLIET